MGRAKKARRRSRGSGSYRWRSARTVELAMRDPETGRLRTKNVEVRNEEEAGRALRTWVNDVLEKRVPEDRFITVRNVADDWLADLIHVRRDLAEGTIANREYQVAHINRRWGNRRISAITKGRHITKLLADFVDDGLSPKTIAGISGTLSAILRYAREHDYIAVNPSDLLAIAQRPRVDQKTVPAPTDADLEAILEAMRLRNDRHYAHLIVMAAVGGRNAEIAALRRRDVVELDDGSMEIVIDKQIVRRRRKADEREQGPRSYVSDKLKTNAGMRRVMIGPVAAAVLRDHLDDIDDEARSVTGEPFPADGYIFSPDPLGERHYYPQSINTRIRRLAAQQGISNVTPHQLRHYAATKIAPHLTPTEMMGRFGWRDERMVRRYVDYRRTRDAEAAAIMDAAVGNVAPIRRRGTAETA